MYTLVVLVALATGHMEGSVALTSQKIESIRTIEMCRAAGEQAVKELKLTSPLTLHVPSYSKEYQNITRAEVRYSCLKTNPGL